MRHLANRQVFSIQPEEGEPVFYRVLMVLRQTNEFVAIEIIPKKSKKRTYFVKHRVFPLDKIEREINNPNGMARIERFRDRTETYLNDDELKTRFPSRNMDGSSKIISHRDARWKLISPVWLEYERALFDVDGFSEFISSYCDDNSIPEKQIPSMKQYLFQYFAGGCVKNALIPLYPNCGGKGKERKFSGKKLGCPNTLTQAGVPGVEGYVCTDEDDKIIRFSWDNFLGPNITVSTAYSTMCRNFYAVKVQGSDYKLSPTLLPAHQRPTRAMFEYRGERLTGKSATEKQRKLRVYRQRIQPLLGRANDGVIAVGQIGALDSTSTDTYLVSILSRLDRIGFANRLPVVDMLYGYIPGFYMGLSAPSAGSVKLALLHALSDKQEWLEGLGLIEECPPEDWLPIQFASVRGDNGELRSEEINRDLLDSGMMISNQYIPSYWSARNGMVEPMHHRIHRLSDHRLLGSTYGKRTERGEEQASIRARLNLMEAIRESARAIHYHNTTPIEGFNQPLDMRRDGIEPTPLAMTRWAIERGNVACTLMDIDEARMRLLPVHAGVFTESGVRLLRPDKGGQRRFIKCLRYVSRHLKIKQRMEAARISGTFESEFYIDPNRLNCIWFKDLETAEFIELYYAGNDENLVCEGTWSDVMAMEMREDQDKFLRNISADQQLSDLHDGQDRTNDRADKEYKREIEQRDKPLTKSDMKGGVEINLEREKDLTIMGIPILLAKGENLEFQNDQCCPIDFDKCQNEIDDENKTIFDAAFEKPTK